MTDQTSTPDRFLYTVKASRRFTAGAKRVRCWIVADGYGNELTSRDSQTEAQAVADQRNAERAGADAYRTGAVWSSNPHANGTPAADHWLAGWTSAYENDPAAQAAADKWEAERSDEPTLAAQDRIVVRAWKGEEHNPIAIFMDQPEGDGLFNSYQHIGQHGGADPKIIHDTLPIALDHPAVVALITELRQIGYNPRVLKRFQRGA